MPTAAGVARVRLRCISLQDIKCGAVLPVLFAGISNEYCLLLDTMSALGSGGARVNRMLVIQALADRVSFENLNAHLLLTCGGDVWRRVGNRDAVVGSAGL